MSSCPPQVVRPICLSIVIPCYNEEGSIKALVDELEKHFPEQHAELRSEFVFVDDGSTDNTWAIISHSACWSNRISGLRFSRNFGHQKALLAGLEYSLNFADYIISMDADLQHPPFIAKLMIDMALGDDYDVISAQRVSTSEVSWVKNRTSKAFYKMLNATGAEITPNASDFRLLSKKAVLAMVSHGDAAFFHVA